MTIIFVLYFVPMLVWLTTATYCFYKDWCDGYDIHISYILWTVVVGTTPLLNIIGFVIVWCHWWETSLSHLKIKGREKEMNSVIFLFTFFQTLFYSFVEKQQQCYMKDNYVFFAIDK